MTSRIRRVQDLFDPAEPGASVLAVDGRAASAPGTSAHTGTSAAAHIDPRIVAAFVPAHRRDSTTAVDGVRSRGPIGLTLAGVAVAVVFAGLNGWYVERAVSCMEFVGNHGAYTGRACASTAVTDPSMWVFALLSMAAPMAGTAWAVARHRDHRTAETRLDVIGALALSLALAALLVSLAT